MLSDPIKRTVITTYLNEYSSLNFLINNNESDLNGMIKNLQIVQKQLLNFIIAFTIRPKLLIIENITTQSISMDDLIDKIYNHCHTLDITIITISDNNCDDKYCKYHHRFLKI